MNTRAHTYERSSRTTNRQAFSGGYVEHGRIEPMQQPSWIERIFGKVGR